MSAKNPHLDYQVISYLNPRNFKIVLAHCKLQHYSKSEAVNKILSDFINKNFNDHQQKKYIELFEKMTPEEKKNPGKIID